MAYQIRAMGLGEILETAFRLLRDHFGLLAGIAATACVPIGALAMLAGLFFSDADAPASLEAPLLVPAVTGVVLALVLLSLVVSCALTHALGELTLGRPVTLAAALRSAASRALPLLGTSLLAAFLVGVGLVLLVAPGLYLLCAFLLVTPVVVLEGKSGMQALGRSQELLRGHLLRGLAVLVVGGLLVSLVGVLIEALLSVIPVLDLVGSVFAQMLGLVYTSAVLVVLYREVRARKESTDHAPSVRAGGVTGPAPGDGA